MRKTLFNIFAALYFIAAFILFIAFIIAGVKAPIFFLYAVIAPISSITFGLLFLTVAELIDKNAQEEKAETFEINLKRFKRYRDDEIITQKKFEEKITVLLNEEKTKIFKSPISEIEIRTRFNDYNEVKDFIFDFETNLRYLQLQLENKTITLIQFEDKIKEIIEYEKNLIVKSFEPQNEKTNNNLSNKDNLNTNIDNLTDTELAQDEIAAANEDKPNKKDKILL
jgi:hypothetical protein